MSNTYNFSERVMVMTGCRYVGAVVRVRGFHNSHVYPCDAFDRDLLHLFIISWYVGSVLYMWYLCKLYTVVWWITSFMPQCWYCVYVVL
jgi:hypothetical protein